MNRQIIEGRPFSMEAEESSSTTTETTTRRQQQQESNRMEDEDNIDDDSKEKIDEENLDDEDVEEEEAQSIYSKEEKQTMSEFKEYYLKVIIKTKSKGSDQFLANMMERISKLLSFTCVKHIIDDYKTQIEEAKRVMSSFQMKIGSYFMDRKCYTALVLFRERPTMPKRFRKYFRKFMSKFIKALNTRSSAMLQKNELIEAREFCSLIHLANPQHVESYFRLVMIYRQMSQFEEALKQLYELEVRVSDGSDQLKARIISLRESFQECIKREEEWQSLNETFLKSNVRRFIRRTMMRMILYKDPLFSATQVEMQNFKSHDFVLKLVDEFTKLNQSMDNATVLTNFFTGLENLTDDTQKMMDDNDNNSNQSNSEESKEEPYKMDDFEKTNDQSFAFLQSSEMKKRLPLLSKLGIQESLHSFNELSSAYEGPYEGSNDDVLTLFKTFLQYYQNMKMVNATRGKRVVDRPRFSNFCQSSASFLFVPNNQLIYHACWEIHIGNVVIHQVYAASYSDDWGETHFEKFSFANDICFYYESPFSHFQDIDAFHAHLSSPLLSDVGVSSTLLFELFHSLIQDDHYEVASLQSNYVFTAPDKLLKIRVTAHHKKNFKSKNFRSVEEYLSWAETHLKEEGIDEWDIQFLNPLRVRHYYNPDPFSLPEPLYSSYFKSISAYYEPIVAKALESPQLKNSQVTPLLNQVL